MEKGKFLGLIVTGTSFKANPDKVQAIARMPSPASLKFLANHAAKSYPFISTLRNCLKKAQFRWTPEAEQAFQEVKKCLMELPTLTAPHAGEPLTLYLLASNIAVGAVLLTDRKNIQTPIYYVSRTLSDPETRYSMLENRLAKWAIELGEHSIKYKPRPAIKGQVLADFVTEVPQHKEQECLIEQQPQAPPEQGQGWSLFTDGASSIEGLGAGLRLVNPEGHEFTYAIKLDFKRQINGTYEAKNDVMASYLSQVRVLIRQFSTFNVVHIKRSENKLADAHSKLASTNFEHFAKYIRVEVLDHPSIP
ncbi:uncharacterized protein LOC143588517 [Bidens hawaiensis]|uniref:uncharacterized protein LOC143588517 n=1 Tax=Bidens hawaiensis TaxID=980011 RepID=UPI00404B4C72